MALQHGLRVELGGRQHERRAEHERLERTQHAAETVVEGHRQAKPVAGGPLDSRAHKVGVVHQVVVGQKHALGTARGAGRVLDVDDVVLVPHSRFRADAAVQHRLPLTGVEKHGRLERMRTESAGLAENIRVADPCVTLVQEDHLHSGAVENVGKVVRPIGGVDIHQDCAGLGGRDLQEDPLDTTGRPHADAVSGPHAQPPQSRRGALNALRKFAVGQANALVPRDDCLLVGVGGDGVVEYLADRPLDQWDRGSCGVALHGSRRRL